MTTKEILVDIANRLPKDATLADAAYELEFRAAVEAGFASLERGEGVPIEEARRRLAKWTTKSFSPTKP